MHARESRRARRLGQTQAADDAFADGELGEQRQRQAALQMRQHLGARQQGQQRRRGAFERVEMAAIPARRRAPVYMDALQQRAACAQRRREHIAAARRADQRDAPARHAREQRQREQAFAVLPLGGPDRAGHAAPRERKRGRAADRANLRRAREAQRRQQGERVAHRVGADEDRDIRVARLAQSHARGRRVFRAAYADAGQRHSGAAECRDAALERRGGRGRPRHDHARPGQGLRLCLCVRALLRHDFAAAAIDF